MINKMKVVMVILIILLSIISSYLALYGWVGIDLNTAIEKSRVISKANESSIPVTYNGVPYESAEFIKIIIRYEIAEKIFPHIYKIPKPICLFITSIAFAYLGGLIKVLYDINRFNKEITSKTLCGLIMSSLNGLLILGVSYVIPSALTASDITLQPLSLMFMCLFAGLFSEQTVSWLQKKYESIISN